LPRAKTRKEHFIKECSFFVGKAIISDQFANDGNCRDFCYNKVIGMKKKKELESEISAEDYS